jgi:hypothetical protein
MNQINGNNLELAGKVIKVSVKVQGSLMELLMVMTKSSNSKNALFFY